MSDREDFARLVDPYRRELLAHCYRLLGSVHDAEDQVQETYLRAWRSRAAFEGRSSLRTWLYRIATNTCLTALEQRARRPLPSGLGGPSAEPTVRGGALPEVSWLEPIPDALVDPLTTDPAAIVAARGSVRLALVAALQHLPTRQRAVLILRDVLGWRAAEVADLLDTSTAAVNSALQRARALLRELAPEEDALAEPADADHRALLDRFATAFAESDAAGLIGLLREDVRLEMPPEPAWFAGREAVARFLTGVLAAPGDWRMVPTRANGQAALASYLRGPDGAHHPHGVHLFDTSAAGIGRIVAFRDPALFAVFGMAEPLDPVVPR